MITGRSCLEGVRKAISVMAGWPEPSIVSKEVHKESSNSETRVKRSGHAFLARTV